MSDNGGKIIRFKRDTTFRNKFFTPESFAHPAKLDSQLLLWIVEKYTNPGETILDPMFGSGTAMLACTIGRNVIGVELEQKFVDMAKANWDKVKQMPQLGSTMGTCQIFQGDARDLRGLLVNIIVTSPPYGNRLSDDAVNDNDPQRMSYRQALEKVDSIVTSPPYAETQTGGGFAVNGYQGDKHSPTDLIGKRSYMPDVHGNSEGQIGNLKYGDIDTVITSPHEGSISGESHTEEARAKEFDKLRLLGYKINPNNADNTENIGNLKSDSYLSAMTLVYQQCFSVLKDGGAMILITKNFIREQKEIHLDLDTIKLCEQSGFTFRQRWYRELPAQSFWRIIYRQKYPDAPELKYEDVLVFMKGGDV